MFIEAVLISSPFILWQRTMDDYSSGKGSMKFSRFDSMSPLLLWVCNRQNSNACCNRFITKDWHSLKKSEGRHRCW